MWNFTFRDSIFCRSEKKSDVSISVYLANLKQPIILL